MQNTNKCKIVPTFQKRKADYMCAQIYVVPFELTNSETRQKDLCGTRDTIVMIMTFEEPYSDGQAGLEGVCVWDNDYCSNSNPSGKMLYFNENTHRNAVTKFKHSVDQEGDGECV
uniref:Uncharacterized protein n=1 Tax=Ditylum brightwellii TaxID=49249 RepID=A0A7S4QH59_9STRA